MRKKIALTDYPTKGIDATQSNTTLTPFIVQSLRKYSQKNMCLSTNRGAIGKMGK